MELLISIIIYVLEIIGAIITLYFLVLIFLLPRFYNRVKELQDKIEELEKKK